MKAVFFDNDGVLVDTEHLYFRATREIFAGRGILLTEKMYGEYFLRQGHGAWFLLEQGNCPPREIERLRRERNRLYAELLREEDVLIPGVDAALQRLLGKVRMAIVTSSRRDHFDLIHRRTGILPYFDFSLTREDYEKAKPDPEPYLQALKRSGCPARECLVVEDSERGLMAAVAAGLRCIVIPRGMSESGNFDGACRIRKKLAEAVDDILQE